MVNWFIQIIETCNILLIVCVTWHCAKTIIFINSRDIVLTIILSDSAKAPLQSAGSHRSICQRLLHYLIYSSAYSNVLFFHNVCLYIIHLDQHYLLSGL